MNVLSIGNSFSCDAQRYLNAISIAEGNEIYCANLYIGGCSLETHVKNLNDDLQAYDFEENGNEGSRRISIKEAINLRKWDVVTLQQVSGQSGITSSFEPYLQILFDFVKKSIPEAKIFFHQTWAYDADSTHPDFSLYSCSQHVMCSSIKKSYDFYSEKYNTELLPVGEAIRYFRENVEPFCSGTSLTRDGFHLSYTYGRFIASLVWYCVLTGRKPDEVDFVPDGADCELIGRIKTETKKFFFDNKPV